jgi:hypothetical protein
MRTPWVAMTCSVALLGSALATGVSTAEPTVGEIYYARYSVPLPPPLPDDGYFFQLAEPAMIAVEALYASASSSLGWYADGDEHLLMDPLVVGRVAEFSVGAGAFGLWLNTEYVGQTAQCYSDPALNGGLDRLLVYETPIPQEYFLAWEDCFSVDGDFNDVVLIGSHFGPTAAPGPSWGTVKGLYR